jgi:hypothetical protein
MPVVALVAVNSIADDIIVDCDQFGLQCWRYRNHGSELFTSILAIGFGFYLVYGRFLLDRKRRGETIYAITNRRCLWINQRQQAIVVSLEHEVDRDRLQVTHPAS